MPSRVECIARWLSQSWPTSQSMHFLNFNDIPEFDQIFDEQDFFYNESGQE